MRAVQPMPHVVCIGDQRPLARTGDRRKLGEATLLAA